MDLMSAMKHALCVGTPKPTPDVQVSKKMPWPAEFRDPVDVALHVGTPKLTGHEVKSPSNSKEDVSHFFD